MPDIHIERKHGLGLARARKVAREWVAQVEQDYGLTCKTDSHKKGDQVQFSGSGINGTVEVTATRFALHARPGFLLDAFSSTIEQRVARKLDELLDDDGDACA